MSTPPTTAKPDRRNISRRAFVAGSAALVAAPAIVAGAGARPRITDGVASGDVTRDSAVIWSRCDRPARMTVDYATTESFRDSKRVQGPDALAETDFTAQAVLAGLPPGETVFYRVRFESLDGGAMSAPEAGRLRTAPDANGSVSFVWGGDMCGAGWGINPDWGGLRMFETMARAEPDFLIHCGDRIYADGPLAETVRLTDGTVWRNIVTPAKSKIAETLDEYRGNYRYNLLDAHYRRFNAQTAQLVTWDDHEVINDWWPGRTAPKKKGYSDRRIDLLAARGRQAFFEYTPIRRNAVEPGRIYRSIRYGPLVEVFLLDERSYRSPNFDTSDQATLLGPAQAAWLKQALAGSTALWKVIVSPLPVAIFGKRSKKYIDKWADGEAGPPTGRERELAGILRAIEVQDVTNTVWLAADVHYAAAHHFHPDRARFTGFKPFWEFIAGPFHTRPANPKTPDPTFGPRVVFSAPKKRIIGNHPPKNGYLYFGHGHIDGKSRALTIGLRDLSGKTLYQITLAAERAR